jgi:arylsulfatase A-like enzyme
MALHLEDHLDAATFTELPAPNGPKVNAPQPVEWRFDRPQPDWKATPLWNPPHAVPTLTRTADALRVTFTDRLTPRPGGWLGGTIQVELPGWALADWTELVVRARTEAGSAVGTMRVGFNLREGRGRAQPVNPPFQHSGPLTPLVRDGAVHTYRLRINRGALPLSSPWRQLVLAFGSNGQPGSIDVLSVEVIPTSATYAGDRIGFRTIAVGPTSRRSLFAHAPGRLEYRVRVPDGARLHAALAVLSTPIEFVIAARPADGHPTVLLRETHADSERWADRTIDLAAFAGQTITLSLETSSKHAGAVAFWGSPTLTGRRSNGKPNVILYVIDGGAADYMSAYGYNRRTTPNLEKLAAEGAIFEHAYSNSTATWASTPSFMTSLQDSVLGNPLPENAVTMAERFHAAGYQTGVFTSNPWAASASQLERGVDVMEDTLAGNHGPSAYRARGADSSSSRAINETFWRWRDTNPSQPYWTHFQTTDVHAPYTPVPPFAGLFVSPQVRHSLGAWAGTIGRNPRPDSPAFQESGIDRMAYFAALQGVYDEMMALNDHEIGRLVDRLKATGEWANTLLIVTGDHGIGPATDVDLGVAMLAELPPPWLLDSVGAPMFRRSLTRVPLVVVWPGHIAGGLRFTDAVSLIDLLPTVLDLAGLPKPEIMQGQSLAPLLRGQPGWTARPVILDFFYPALGPAPPPDRLSGRLEVVDGRWGASMWIGPLPASPVARRPWPVVVFDLWSDPLCLAPLNEQHPDLVKKYTKFLEDTWKDHQALAKQFTPGAKSALSPDQLERLRSLGYIR